VEPDYRVRSTEYGLRSAGGARERQLGWHAVPTLPRDKRRRGAEGQAGGGRSTRGWIIFGGDGAWGVAGDVGLGN